ncbi:cation diffusion facilitator family transporter [Paenisporosarcina cavernae]|uniref:Cation transporter n=1 Tax=Paenisporosarcina cavernae TaxID=2320858 RepID=A0A385YVB1_9BACL|nr:cation diffusion facilitator family transporter [Paenisporosarcina cavernae]AYC30835.1 cation transporter [Paenisporosarcina cavernae]
MAHNHDHSHNHHFHEKREGNRKGLIIALLITAGIMVLEFFGGLFTNSLALLADSGHMLSDVASLALSLLAVWFASRPASKNKTYGYYRFEILAALFNGVTLFVIAGFIIYEAIGRFMEPPTVASGTMMIIAAIGLFANIMSAWSLTRTADVKDNVNLKSAYLHILGDALGSIGAIIAGVLMLLLDWYIADPIISVIVALLILKSAWGVLTQSVHILMEGTPPTMDKDELTEKLITIDGVKDVHDLHIWTITSGLDSLSCHMVIEDLADEQSILQKAIDLVKQEYKIEHTTIQVEKSNLQHTNCEFC